MTFRSIHEHRGRWLVQLLCEALKVSSAGYYAWRQRPICQRCQALMAQIQAIHLDSKARYGSPRMSVGLLIPDSWAAVCWMPPV
jgi:putative transposase